MKKEVKHDCPDDMIYSNRKGKCVIPGVEDESVNSDSSIRNIVPNPALRFPNTVRNRGTPQEGMDSNIDVTVQQSNADKLQDKVQQVNKRAPGSVDDRNVVGIKTKPFSNFKAKHSQFTSVKRDGVKNG